MLIADFHLIRKKNAQKISRPFRKLSFASRRGISVIPEEDMKGLDPRQDQPESKLEFPLTIGQPIGNSKTVFGRFTQAEDEAFVIN